MTNSWILLLIFVFLFVTNCLCFGYGLRIGKALQKEPPPVPLAEPAKEASKVVKRAGKRMYRLITNMKEAKAFKKPEKEETSIFD